MNEQPAPHHAHPRPAELAAAVAVAPHLKAMKTSIVALTAALGETGLTPDEYQRETGALINTVRRRFTDLWKEGHLRPTDRTRPNARGNPETVWVVGRDEAGMAPAAAKARPQAVMRARILRLEDALRGTLDLLEADGSRHNVWRAALDNKPWPPKTCCEGWGNGHWMNAANECHALSSQPGDRWVSLS